MSTLYKILFVEEPIHFTNEQEFTAVISEVSPQLHILQPRINRMEDLERVLKNYVSNTSVLYGWFYSASFIPVLRSRKFETIIYDCMDELSLFKGAPLSLINQEEFLLKEADIVFTGGKSLFESKQKLHDHVFCFPSSVDESHFRKAIQDISVPDDISSIKGPVVGYFGVIDERINLDLILESSLRLPGVSFVMIGPVTKIEEGELPRLPNIHYLGMKTYEVLPSYLKAFDIAMMPFSLNDSTKYISPTKTLEYMAAGKPIISTRIKDVERDYSHCVKLVDSVDEFCQAVLDLLTTELEVDYSEILSQTSWNVTAIKMQKILNENLL